MDGFGPDDQRRFAEVFAELAGRGCRVVHSNSDVPVVRDLHATLESDEIDVRRSISCRGDTRGATGEVIVHAEPPPMRGPPA